MKVTPVLFTRRLTLDPYTVESVTERHVRWLNDPDIVVFSDQLFKRHTLKTQRAYAKTLEEDPNRHGWLLRVGGEKDIGTITATIDRGRVADMGILLGEEYEQGYATEAWLVVMQWLLADAGMKLVTCGCRKGNVSMRLLAQRVGMMQICDSAEYVYFEADSINPLLLRGREKERQ